MGNQPPPIIQTSTDSTEGKTGRDCPASARSFHLFAMSWTNHANGMTNWKKCWSKNSCLLSLTAIYPLVMTNIAMENQYRQLRAGNLEGDSRTPTGVLQSFSQGGALGINLMMLEPWQLVLGGFWNHIMGNQENDPRTPSFWSLPVIKKQSQQLHLSKTRNLTNSIIRLLPLLPC